MPKITRENCKAPSWDEFPKLSKIGAEVLFAEARQIKRDMAELKLRLSKLAPRLMAKMQVGLDDDVRSVLYEDMLVSRREGYTRHSLNTKWAVKKLLAKGVKKAEIDAHTKETEIDPTVSVQLLGEEED